MANRLPGQKSAVRVSAEAALKTAGLEHRNWCTFTDTGKLATRVKFSFVRPTDGEMSTIKRSFAARHPGKRTEVYMGGTSYPGGYFGVCLKVYK